MTAVNLVTSKSGLEILRDVAADPDCVVVELFDEVRVGPVVHSGCVVDSWKYGKLQTCTISFTSTVYVGQLGTKFLSV